MKLPKTPVRLTIYFLYDQDGIADRYVLYMLERLRCCCKELIVVSNGTLREDSAQKVSAVADVLLQRENMGYDVEAYRAGLKHYAGGLEQFDEVVFTNSTLFGPVFPFETVYREMDRRDVDFWGLTLFHGVGHDPFGKCKYGYLPEHLQSHFIAVRRSMLINRAFEQYWKTLPPIKSYTDSICYYEAVFTKHFADLGFAWDVFADTRPMREDSPYPLVLSPVETLKKFHCPVLKRRSFFQDYAYPLSMSAGGQGRALMEYLDSQTDYPTDFIWENLLRTAHMADLKNNLGLQRVLPLYHGQGVPAPMKMALCLYVYYEDCAEECLSYVMMAEPRTDIYLLVVSAPLGEKLRERLLAAGYERVKVRTVENRGRDVAAFLLGCRDIMTADYELVCFIHDKKSAHGDGRLSGKDFAKHCFENLLGSREYVQNIMLEFQREPRLGLLSPPPPCEGAYCGTIGQEWGANFDNTAALAEKLGLHVPISKEKEPVAPLGTMFWTRPAAMGKLFAQPVCYEDFPLEPVAPDGTALHAWERVYALAVQDAGYYCAWCLNDRSAERYLHNAAYLLRTERKAEPSVLNVLWEKWKRLLRRHLSDEKWNRLREIYHKHFKRDSV